MIKMMIIITIAIMIMINNDDNDDINDKYVIVISHQREICESSAYTFMICEVI